MEYSNEILEKKPAESFSEKDGKFAILFALACIFTAIFGVFGGFALGFTLSYLIIFALTVAYLRESDFKLKPYPLLCGILSVLASFVYTLYDDTFMNSVLFFVIIGLFSIFVGVSTSNNQHQTGSYRSLFDVVNIAIVSPIKNVLAPFHAMKADHKSHKSSKNILKIIVGCLVSLPILLIVFFSLVSADLAFERFVSTMLLSGIVWSGSYAFQVIFGLIIAVFVFSFAYDLKKKKAEKTRRIFTETTNTKRIDATIFNTVLVILSICYLVYLLSQFTYFFNGFSGILPADYHFTPAQYARRGFFEMATIVGINIGIVGLAGILIKGKPVQMPTLTKALCTFINAFSLVLVCTAFSKMIMYINIYGLSRKRVLTSIAMVIFTIIIVCVTVKIFVPHFKYVEFIIIICTIFGLGVAYADIDTQIARCNYNSYVAGNLKNIDMSNMTSLSKSVVPYMMKLTNDSDRNVADQAKRYLYELPATKNAILSFNFVDNRAYRIRTENEKVLNAFNEQNEINSESESYYVPSH